MRCPFCHSMNDKVVNSRVCQEGESIRRRRECLDCGKRFTTFEYIEGAELHVIKRNGQRESFDRAKLKRGIWKACEKRPVTEEDVDAIVSFIEKEIQNRMDLEIQTRDLGDLVLKRLRILDEVAYVRFASVYRDFREASQFRDEALNLLKKD
ncbi:transcriptional repressor NrdR [Candidatus Sumerlaeota bacterium]|nr:transcriptional repressor NrdR [Candidatus Sumerlaeota bacterium]